MKYDNWDAVGYRESHAFVYEYGEDVLALLNPGKGERILDLGCGTGELTAQIAEQGAQVIGVDASLAMLEKAREKYPDIFFFQQDILALDGAGQYDAVFSNAVLHWIPGENQQQAMNNVYRALRPGGRFVAEFGGIGNCNAILTAFGAALEKRGLPSQSGFYYPTIGEHTALLEQAGFLVCYAALFPRPTPLEGEAGMENWLRMFRAEQLARLEKKEQQAVLAETVEALRDTPLYKKQDKSWQADYIRLRFVAERLPDGGSGVPA